MLLEIPPQEMESDHRSPELATEGRKSLGEVEIETSFHGARDIKSSCHVYTRKQRQEKRDKKEKRNKGYGLGWLNGRQMLITNATRYLTTPFMHNSSTSFSSQALAYQYDGLSPAKLDMLDWSLSPPFLPCPLSYSMLARFSRRTLLSSGTYLELHPLVHVNQPVYVALRLIVPVLHEHTRKLKLGSVDALARQLQR